MAVRTVEFKVSESGILPSSQQFGGVQGEHRATCVSFTLEEDLFNKISASADGNRVVCRFDAYDGAGGFKSTEPIELVNEPLVFYLDEWQTRFGGNVSVFLVITEIEGDSTKIKGNSTEIKDYLTEMELYSFPAVLRLKNRPDGEAVDGGNYESVSTLAESAKNSAKNAQESAEAAAESLDELLASVPKVDVLEVTDGVEIKVTEKDEVSVAKVSNGKDGADGKDGKDADLSLVANALKGSASGQGFVVAKDVSPLEHEVKVQLSNSSGGGEESVSQTATLNGTMRELLLDEPSSKVHVKFEQVDTYCDGAIVPLVDGEDLKAVADVIVSPAYWYSEQLTLLDITYTITDSTLEWKGTYTSLTDTEAEPEEISGSYTLSSSGQKIIGFYQIYEEPEDNPHYSYGGEYAENSLDIIVSVLANSFSGVAVTVGGKNLLNLEGRSVVNFGGWDATNKRQYQGGKGIILGYAANNYYNGGGNNPIYSVTSNEIRYTLTMGAYGIGVDVKLKPNTEYKLSCSAYYGWAMTLIEFDAEGNFLGTMKNGKTRAETDWGLVYISSSAKGEVVYLTNPQLEYGTVKSEYEPYIEPATYTANADGSVDGVKSIYPSTSVSVEDASTVVNIEYNRDINKAFAELQAAVISLGGNV